MKDIVHRGITWRDFPGSGGPMNRRLMFAEFRRGLHAFNAHCEGLEGAALKEKLAELARCRRMRWQRFKI